MYKSYVTYNVFADRGNNLFIYVRWMDLLFCDYFIIFMDFGYGILDLCLSC